jgi:ribulose kinase
MSERPAAIRQARERSIVMTDGPYLLGIDFGTGGARVGIFDPEGTPLVFSEREYTLVHPRPGWAEQDPDEWWSSLVAAVRSAMEESSISPEDIAGISVDAMSSTVLAMDENDRHLRPAIMWMDVRSSEQADRIAGTNNNALKYNGYGAVSAEWGLPKALWIKENEPGVYKQARHICDCGDWLIQRLTGEWTSSINMASSKYYYDRDEGGYPESLYDAVDAGDLLEKFPNEVLDLGTVAGGLRKEAAEELGLKAGTPVAEGGVDAYVGAIGLGVVEPGKMALITGSSHVMIGQSARPIHDPGFWGAYTDAMIPGQYSVEAGQASTGSIVAWFKNQFAGDAAAEARERGVDTYDVLTEQARRAHRFGWADRTRLLPGQQVSLYRPPGSRHDVGTDPEPHPWTRLPRHHRGHLLRYGEHPAHHARTGLRAEAQRRLRWTGQERVVDADARRRVESADLVHQSERGPRPRLGDAGRRRGRYLP